MSSSIWLNPLIHGIAFAVLFTLLGIWTSRRAARKAQQAATGEQQAPVPPRIVHQVASGILAGTLFGLIKLVEQMRAASLLGPGWDYVLYAILGFGTVVIFLGLVMLALRWRKSA